MNKETGDHDWIAIGQLQGSFGVKGWVRVISFTDPYEHILDFSEWWIAKSGSGTSHGEPSASKKFTLLSGQKHRQGIVAQLQGVHSLEEAQTLSGQDVWVPRGLLPEPDDGTHYWADMVGLMVVTTEGVFLGNVSYLFATGANDVLVVHAPDGEEKLLPFTHEVVQNVDISARTITVSLMPGM